MPRDRALNAVLSICVVVCAALLCATSAHAVPRAGVQGHLLWSGVSAEDVSTQLDAVEETGASLVRVDVGWSSIEEQAQGQRAGWYLDKLDYAVAEAGQRGLKLLLTLSGTPCWASSAPSDVKRDCEGAWWNRGVQSYAPKNAKSYARIARYLARRYRGEVLGWEIWNEPNSAHFFNANNPARKYARLVRKAYPAIKKGDPHAQVIAGSLMHSDRAFVRKLYRHGIKGKFDGFSIHPYSDDRSPLDPDSGQPPTWSFVRGVPAIRRLLVKKDDKKPLWLTEFGWNTSLTRNAEPYLNGVSETIQGRWIKQAFRQMSQWSWVRAGVVYGLQDTGSDRYDYLSNFGLLRYDGSPKPAFYDFSQMAQQLEQERQQRLRRR